MIHIEWTHGKVEAELNNSPTAQLIRNALPIKGNANLWGDEIYFEIPITSDEKPTVEEVEIGDLGYWPPGNAFCIFFGKTPVSTGDKPRAASSIIPLGKITSGIEELKKVKHGETITISL